MRFLKTEKLTQWRRFQTRHASSHVPVRPFEALSLSLWPASISWNSLSGAVQLPEVPISLSAKSGTTQNRFAWIPGIGLSAWVRSWDNAFPRHGSVLACPLRWWPSLHSLTICWWWWFRFFQSVVANRCRWSLSSGPRRMKRGLYTVRHVEFVSAVGQVVSFRPVGVHWRSASALPWLLAPKGFSGAFSVLWKRQAKWKQEKRAPPSRPLMP